MKGSNSGIGGWLACLIFWMVILRPVAGIYMWQQMHVAFLDDPSVVKNSTWLVNTSSFWILILGLAALSIYGGLRLWRERRPAAVRTAILILWITIPIASVALILAEAYLSGSFTLRDAAQKVTINVAVAAIWTAYLRRSRRVRRTYFESAAASDFRQY